MANYSNSPSFFANFHNFHSITYVFWLFPINTRKDSWSAVIYASTYTVGPYGLLLVAIDLLYSYREKLLPQTRGYKAPYHYIPCSIPIIAPDSFTVIMNYVMITSIPNIVTIPLFSDALVIISLYM